MNPDNFLDEIDIVSKTLHDENYFGEPKINPTPAWRHLFKSRNQMEHGPIKFLIEEILHEGICFFGALSGGYKTWLALSMAKAISTGQPFLGKYAVPERRHVLYLVPEAGERAFRNRMEKMGIEDSEWFLVRTMQDGNLSLTDPLLLHAMRDLSPVVFLDTAVRFSNAESENSSNENNKGLANGIFELRRAGAIAVVGMHHSPKGAADKDMSLENALRGTGDFGAMCDIVYALQVKDVEMGIIEVKNVKPREFDEVPPSFRIQARPYINTTGDFKLLPSGADATASEKDKLLEAISSDPKIDYRAIANKTGILMKKIKALAAEVGFTKIGDTWIRHSRTNELFPN